MSDAAGVDRLTATPDERTMGTLAHVLQLVGGFIAPLIIFLIKRDSRFVSFHALQALLLQALYFLVVMLMMGAIFAAVIAGVAFHQPAAGNNSLPPAFVILFPVVWLGMMGWWVFILVVAIVYGIKAGRGEWAEYPALGRLARRILRIGPGGEFLA
ncbi:MAG: DUF4870 domain-containing protein [Candidatus Sulfotelmatobacter sp.]